uniref:Uncharacterized protein n=2 Tax=Physcomitrium patens TaxID=3218 RepID=A0A2K1JGM0_PHYPA|nr:hypothetical protein PHYPA_018113 [Physcomitrium patens]
MLLRMEASELAQEVKSCVESKVEKLRQHLQAQRGPKTIDETRRCLDIHPSLNSSTSGLTILRKAAISQKTKMKTQSSGDVLCMGCFPNPGMRVEDGFQGAPLIIDASACTRGLIR